MTILAGIYGFFGSDPGFVSRITSRPGFVNPVQYGPGFDNAVRSDPIRSDPGFVNAHVWRGNCNIIFVLFKNDFFPACPALQNCIYNSVYFSFLFLQ